MRLNLNQQSNGPAWTWHKNLIDSADPDRRLRRALCRRDVPADRRQAGARARHRRQALGRGGQAELRPSARHLRRRLGRLVRGRLGADDERGGLLREGRGRAQGRRLDRRRPVGRQGPSSTDVSDSADIDRHTKTDAHPATTTPRSGRTRTSSARTRCSPWQDEPGHQELCDREQAFFLKAIQRRPRPHRIDGCGGQQPADRAGGRAVDQREARRRAGLSRHSSSPPQRGRGPAGPPLPAVSNGELSMSERQPRKATISS